MKIRNYLTILFAVVAIFALVGLAGYMTYITTDDSHPVKKQVAELLHLEDKDTTAETSSVSETETATEASDLASHSFLFVGDSRAIGMRDAVGDSCTYIAAEGEGYSWYSAQGNQTLRQALENDPLQTVILWLGINDPENINNYIDIYKTMVNEYSDSPIYMMSVTPLDDDADFNTTNEMVELFNETLKSAFPDRYIDCYSYLNENGYQTVDGLHYDEDTYRSIHRFVVNTLIS